MTIKDINAISIIKIPKKIKSLLSLLNISIMFIACAESTGTEFVYNSVTDCLSARGSLERCLADNSQTTELGYQYEVNCGRQLKLVQQFCKFSLDMDIDLGQVLPDHGIDESLDQDIATEDQMAPQEDRGVLQEDQDTTMEDQGVPEEDQNMPMLDQRVPEQDQGLIQDMGNELVYPDNIPVEHRNSIDEFIQQAGNESCLDGLHRYTAILIERSIEAIQTQDVTFVENCLNRGFERVAFRRIVNLENGDVFSFDDQTIAGNGCFDVGGSFYLVPFSILNLSHGFDPMHFISISNDFNDYVFSIRFSDGNMIVRKSNTTRDFVVATHNACE